MFIIPTVPLFPNLKTPFPTPTFAPAFSYDYKISFRCPQRKKLWGTCEGISIVYFALLLIFRPLSKLTLGHELSPDLYFIAVVKPPTMRIHLFNRIVFANAFVWFVVDSAKHPEEFSLLTGTFILSPSLIFDLRRSFPPLLSDAQKWITRSS